MHHLTHEPSLKDFEVFQGRKIQDQAAYEEKIEARFRRLSDDLQQFISSLQAACLAEHSPAREILEELAIKHCALAWIIRTARHSQGAARRRLWPDIERSVGDLETTLRLVSRLEFVGGHWRVPANSPPPPYDDVC